MPSSCSGPRSRPAWPRVPQPSSAELQAAPRDFADSSRQLKLTKQQNALDLRLT